MSKRKKCLINLRNKKEILYNFINATLAGLLVFLGACTNGEISSKGIIAAIIASLIVMATKFKEYWDGEKKEYTTKLFTFIK